MSTQINRHFIERPVRAITSNTVLKCCCSDNSAVLLFSDNTVWRLGHCYSGALGASDNKNNNGAVLQQLDVPKAIDISHGQGKTFIITEDKILLGLGSNSYDALGTAVKSTDTPLEIPKERYNHEIPYMATPAHSFSIVVTESSNAFMMGQNWLDPDKRGTFSSVCYPISHITSNNRKIVQVTSGAFHVGILTNSGDLYTGGDFTNSKLGREQTARLYGFLKVDTNSFYTSMHMLSDYSVFGTRDGQVIFCGGDHKAITEIMALRSPIKQVAICMPTPQSQNKAKQVMAITQENQVFLYNVESKEIKSAEAPTSGDIGIGCSLDFVVLYRTPADLLNHFLFLKRIINTDHFSDITVIQ